MGEVVAKCDDGSLQTYEVGDLIIDSTSIPCLPDNIRYKGMLGLLNNLPNCICNDVTFSGHNNTIVGSVDPAVQEWCIENDIRLSEKTHLGKPFPITFTAIDDPTEFAQSTL